MSLPAPNFGYNERAYTLPGFNPLTGYFPTGTYPGRGHQIPTLSAAYKGSFGVYYIDNSSNFVEYQLSNGSVRTLAHVIPLYQLYPSYGTSLAGMLDNEFFIDYGYQVALFFGTTSNSGKFYSIELVNLTTAKFQMWNTSASVDSFNQQPNYVGNSTVIVLSSNCSIYAWNLASHLSWNAGTLGSGFGSGTTCFEANNAYWFPQKRQLINVEAHGDTGDHVEQLNGTFSSQGQIQLTSAATVAVDTGDVFNWVNGLAYNASTNQIAFTAGYWVTGPVYTYVISYSSKGLLTTSGEVKWLVYNGGTTITGKAVEIQRYVYTSDYVVGQDVGPAYWTNSTQYMFDPWNGSTMLANRTVDRLHMDNYGFEGRYAASPNYMLDYNATVAINDPMYQVVYAYHGPFTVTPGVSEVLTPSSGPNRTLVTVSGTGLLPGKVFDYCWTGNSSAVGCATTHNFTSTSQGEIPTGVTITRTGGTAWLAVSRGTSSANFSYSAQFTVTSVKLVLGPSSGPNRTLVQLSGSGFGPDTRYDYCWVGNSSATGCAATLNFTTNASGGLPAGVNSTRSGTGWLAISQGTSSTNFIVSSKFTLSFANLSLTPSAGPNGTLVALKGTGYGASTLYRICWAGNSSATGCASTLHFTTNSTGGIPAAVTVTYAGGHQWVALAQGPGAANYIISSKFIVTTAILSLSPNRGPNGTAVTLAGSGFANNTRYQYCAVAGSSAVGCGPQYSFLANGSGGIPGSTTLAWSGGDGWLAVSQGGQSANFILSSRFTTTTAALVLSPKGGPPGTEVGVGGSGLVPNTPYQYCLTTSSAPIGCPAALGFTSNASGDVPAGIAFPWPASGSWLAVSEGSASANFIVATQFQLTVPTLSLTPALGPNGTLVSLVGTGLAALTQYDYCWTSDSMPVGCPGVRTFTSTSVGAIPSGITITESGGAAWLAISEGPSSLNFIVSTGFTFTQANLVLTPGSGPNRTQVALLGSGLATNTVYDFCWAPSAQPVGCSPNASFTSTGFGSIPVSINATQPANDLWVAISQGPAAANFIVSTKFVLTTPSLALTPASGPNGTILGVTGTGLAPATGYHFCWVPSSSPVGCPAVQTFSSDPNGRIPAGVLTTWSGAGTGWLAVVQGTTAANFITSTAFRTTIVTLSLTPASGPVRTLVAISGSGFAPATTYDYCFNQSAGRPCPGLHTFTTDGSGALPPGVELRAPATANLHIDFSQGTSQPIASATFQVTVPRIALTVPGGPTNAMTRVSGSGFAGGGIVLLVIGGANVTAISDCHTGTSVGSTINSNGTGSFDCALRIPSGSPKGLDAVTATDGNAGATAQAAFTVSRPSIILSALSGGRGDTINVTGSGFDHSGNVTFALGSLAIATFVGCPVGAAHGPVIAASASGGFECAFLVPQGSAIGALALVATATDSGAVTEANFTVLAPPASPPATFLGLPAPLGFGVIGLLVVVALVAALLISRRRRNGPGQNAEPSSESDDGPASDVGAEDFQEPSLEEAPPENVEPTSDAQPPYEDLGPAP